MSISVADVLGGNDATLVVCGHDSALANLFELADSQPARDVLQTGLSVLLRSSEEIARRYPGLIDAAEAAGMSAGAVLPLRAAAGALLGVLGCSWHVPQSFSAGQLRRLDLVARLTGVALERASSEEPGRDHVGSSALESMPNAVVSLDAALRVTYANPEAERLFSYSGEELVGRKVAEVAVGPMLEARCHEVAETKQGIVFEAFHAPVGGWFEVHVWPDRKGTHLFFLDISDRRKSELQQTSALSEAERANQLLRLFGEISAQLDGVSTRAEVFERLADAIVPAFADWCTLVVPQGEELVRVAAVHRDAVLSGLARRLVGSYPHAFSGHSPGVVAYRTREPLRLARLAQQIIMDLDDSAASHAYARTLMLLGDGPGLIMPFIARDEVVAVLTMIRSEREGQPAEPMTDADVTFMHEVERRVAGALDDARNVETQRQTASALQAAALPQSLPVSDQLALGAGYRVASEGIEVGGDWYDAFELPGGKLALVVGDAGGHGLQAAAAMAQMRNELRAYLFSSLGPLESLASLNRLLVAQAPDTFATIICVEIEPPSGVVRWASAGHPAPVLVHADGTSTSLRGQPMPPIGFADGAGVAQRVEHEFVLKSHDRLLLFTDGLVERRGVDWEIGLTHLMFLAEQTRAIADPATACERILRNMLTSSHEDDVCLLLADFTETDK